MKMKVPTLPIVCGFVRDPKNPEKVMPIDSPMDETSARKNWFTQLAGPFFTNELDMAQKFLHESYTNNRLVVLVEKRVASKTSKTKYYEVWQKSKSDKDLAFFGLGQTKTASKKPKVTKAPKKAAKKAAKK